MAVMAYIGRGSLPLNGAEAVLLVGARLTLRRGGPAWPEYGDWAVMESDVTEVFMIAGENQP